MNISQESAETLPLLEVRHLAKNFGAVRAVDDVSFTIQPGQTVSLIGPNGSGKTSTINLISGVLRLPAGQVLLDGKRISGISAEQIAEHGVARTFQNGRVFGNMSVSDNVLVGMHSQLKAARPFASLRHIPVFRWVSLLAEVGVAIVRPQHVRREERERLFMRLPIKKANVSWMSTIRQIIHALI